MRIGINYFAACESTPGGIGAHIRGLTNELSRLTDVVAIGPNTPREACDAPLISLGRRLPRRLWLETALPLALRREQVDWVIDPAFSTPPLFGPRTLVWMQDSVPFNGHGPGGLRELLLRTIARDSLRRARLLIFSSEAVLAEYLKAGLVDPSDPRTRVVQLGVDPAFISSAAHQGALVGWIGSAGARKDFATFAAAVDHLQLDWSQVLVIGQPPSSCPPTATRLSGGSSADVRAAMSTCRVMVVSSHYEGFSLPVAEASALGVPLVLSDIPVHREVAPLGSAEFYQFGNASALAETLRHERHGLAPHQRWSRTWAEVARDVLDILESHQAQ